MTVTFRTDLFAGGVALVVGGTTGIGAATADALAMLGAVVTVTGDINLTGTMRCCTAARAKLKARPGAAGGAIVNLASMLSFQAGGTVPAYSASKGGVVQLTKALAIAYAADGVRVNAVAPGWVKTALTQPLQDDAQRSAAILARTPLGRWAEPADIADAVVFLCSPAAVSSRGLCSPSTAGISLRSADRP